MPPLVISKRSKAKTIPSTKRKTIAWHLMRHKLTLCRVVVRTWRYPITEERLTRTMRIKKSPAHSQPNEN